MARGFRWLRRPAGCAADERDDEDEDEDMYLEVVDGQAVG